nr:hypothetical protein [Tanacetum cinerariifolium]
MYNVDLKNVVPLGYLTCLFAKATLDESNLWHRRLGHINFKTMNKLVKGNLVRGLPSKIFENSHTCVACQKRKQHRASWNQPNDYAGIQENLDAGKVWKETVSAQQYVMLPLWSTSLQDPQNTDVDDAAFDVKENENENEVRVSPSESNKTKKHNDKAKRDDKGKNTSKYPNDPDMPELEDIVYSNDEEDVDAEADLTNLETNIHVSPILTTRVYKDHPVNQIIGDLNLAPQTRSMTRMGKEQEPKKVHQALKDPSWIEAMQEELLQFKMQKEEGIDYDAVFALVSRIEAIWLFLAYASFMGFMVYQMDVKSAFLYGTIEEEVYVCQPLGFEDLDYPDKVYKVVKALCGLHQAPRAWYETLVYMDDIIFGSTNKELCKAFKKLMMDKFQMSFMGELTFFLGLQVKQKDDGIFISQDKYVAKILRKFGFTNVKSASTPIETEKPLLKDPDVKRNFRYLKGTPHLGLWYPKDSPFNLVAYFDSDYAGASLDRKSTTGATASCCAQVLWIQNQLLDYGKELASPKQTALGKDISNSFMAGSLPKTICRYLCVIEAQQHISNESPLIGVNTPRCDEDSLELLELMVFMYALVVNLTIYVSCINQFWASTTIKKVNDVVQLRALIDGKKVVVTEDVIRQDLHLDDADGVECLSNEEIFAELALLKGLRGTSSDVPWHLLSSALLHVEILTSLMDDLTSHNTKYTSPALTQKVFANMRRVGKEEDEMPIAPALPSPINAPLPPLQDLISTPPQAQPATPHTSPPQVAELEQDKHTQALEILKLKKRVKKLEKKKSRSSGVKIEAIDADEDTTLVDVKTQVDMDAELQKRIDQDVSATTKDVSAAEPTMFDDEENVVAEQIQEKHLENIKKYQSLKRKPISIAQARKNMIIYLKNMAGYKMEHFRGITYDKVRPIFEREYKKVQILFKPDKDAAEPRKKRVAEETLLQESFKKLKAVEVSSSDSTQETLSNDPKEMSEEDVQNMLKIVLVSEFKVEALQVKESFMVKLKILFKPDADDMLWKLQRYMHYLITWKLYTNCGVHQVSSTARRHDMFMLIEKDYPLSNGVMTLMLSAKLQVEEDSEMARDLVMKIFMEANKPKSRSLDTSSK